MKKEKQISRDEKFLQRILMDFSFAKSIDAKDTIDKIVEYIDTVRNSSTLSYAPEDNFHAFPEQTEHRNLLVKDEKSYKALNTSVIHSGSFSCLKCEQPVRFIFEKPGRLTGIKCSDTKCSCSYTVYWQEADLKVYLWPSDFVLLAEEYEASDEWSHLSTYFHTEWWTEDQYTKYILGAD